MKAEAIGDVVAIGGLLREAKEQLHHGRWLPWLQREFGYSARTAQNYMGAHKFAGRCHNIANLKLTSTAVYHLADSGRRGARSSLYTAEAIAAVLAEAKETRVGAARAEEIAMSLRREPEASTPGHRPDAEPETNPSPLQPPRRHEMPPSAKNSRLRSRKWSSLPRSRARSLLM